MVISMSTETLLHYGCFAFLLLSFLSVDGTESRQIPDLHEDSTGAIFSSTQATVAVCLSAVSFLVVAVVIIFKCGDCYNSEVSSEFHPASNSGTGTPKWGGAVGYSTENARSGTITFGETGNNNTSSSQGLPYSMIPTSIPEHGGFAGYQTGGTGEGGSTTGAPLVGYQNSNSNATAPALGGERGSRHYNPAEAQEPPPSYHESQRGSSLRGYR